MRGIIINTLIVVVFLAVLGLPIGWFISTYAACVAVFIPALLLTIFAAAYQHQAFVDCKINNGSLYVLWQWESLTHNAICQAHIMDAGEVYYLGSDEDTDKFSTNRIFEELPYKVFRVKIADLLKRDTECQPSV